MQRCILHLDLDSFFASVECLKNPKLTGKPVIIGGSSNRGVVSSCSYEARAYGISSAMPIKMARILCPEGIFIKGDMERYSYFSKTVGEVIQQQVPVFEKASIDEFYADLSGMDRYFGCYSFSNGLAQKVVQETGLPISWALSVNKLVAKVATNEAKPRGSLMIKAGEEKGFVAPLPVKKIPGIGSKIFKQLSAMGVKRVKTLASIPIPYLEKEFGKIGKQLWEKANAIDHREVVPYSEGKSISKEKTFDSDTTDLVFIKSCFYRMGENLAFQLRAQGKLTGCVTVKVRYSDFNTYTLQKKIPLTASDPTILDTIVELFGKLHQKRLLVRLVGVQLSHLVSGNYQIDLFEDTLALTSLNQAMDRIKVKFGSNSIMRAISIKKTPNLTN